MKIQLIALLLVGCENRSQVFPDGGFNPNHKLVLCSEQPCEGALRDRQGSCPEGSQCVSEHCDDAGVCQGFCFTGVGLNGQCDTNGCCAFSCNGIAGSSCPAAMSCQSSPVCCDVAGTCTR